MILNETQVDRRSMKWGNKDYKILMNSSANLESKLDKEI
jgi:hypothetical protein